jgi:hypothetical protein
VVAKPISYNGAAPSVVRIRNVTSAGFEIRVQEWDYLDGSHSLEEISWLAVERGHWTLDGGAQVEAGDISTDSCGVASFDSVTFLEGFSTTPVVMTSVATVNESDAVATRNRDVTTTGFEVTMQEQESNVQSHASESISYIAWEAGTGNVSGMDYEVGTESVPDQAWATIGYGPFVSVPVFLADMQSTDDTDPCNVRYQNKTAGTVDVRVHEERSADTERVHSGEEIGYFAFY